MGLQVIYKIQRCTTSRVVRRCIGCRGSTSVIPHFLAEQKPSLTVLVQQAFFLRVHVASTGCKYRRIMDCARELSKI